MATKVHREWIELFNTVSAALKDHCPECRDLGYSHVTKDGLSMRTAHRMRRRISLRTDTVLYEAHRNKSWKWYSVQTKKCLPNVGEIWVAHCPVEVSLQKALLELINWMQKVAARDQQELEDYFEFRKLVSQFVRKKASWADLKAAVR